MPVQTRSKTKRARLGDRPDPPYSPDDDISSDSGADDDYYEEFLKCLGPITRFARISEKNSKNFLEDSGVSRDVLDSLEKDLKKQEATIHDIISMKNKNMKIRLYAEYKNIVLECDGPELSTNLIQLKDTIQKAEEEFADSSLENIDAPDHVIQSIKHMKMMIDSPGTSDNRRESLRDAYDIVLSLPYNVIKPLFPPGSEIVGFLSEKRALLDKKLYGMANVKDRLLEIINKSWASKDNRGFAIALCGKPGVGKTTIVKTFAEIMHIPFEIVPMAGADTGRITGDRSVWSGSRPSDFVTCLRKMQCSNGCILFDEIDKTADGDGKRASVQNALLHVTDRSQNSEFKDEYIKDIPIDLSRLWMFFTLNSIDFLSPAFRDRLEMISVGDYTRPEKVQIFGRHIIPKVSASYNMQNDTIFTNDVLDAIVSRHENDNGLRELERITESVFSKLCAVKNSPGAHGIFSWMENIPDVSFPLNVTFDLWTLMAPKPIGQTLWYYS